MKTNNYFKPYFPVLFLSFLLVTTGFQANAQNRRNADRGKKYSRTEYRNSNRKEARRQFAERTENRNERSYRYHADRRNYERDNYNYSRNETRRIVARHNRPVYYTHPRYGRVYHRFDRNPIVLRHNRANYYYYRNHFYAFRPGIGYCVVDFPRHMYFDRLPFACEPVYVNGLRYYRYGDLYFRLFRGRYMVVPSPIQITFSARF